jgi:hypothetical protein
MHCLGAETAVLRLKNLFFFNLNLSLIEILKHCYIKISSSLGFNPKEPHPGIKFSNQGLLSD